MQIRWISPVMACLALVSTASAQSNQAPIGNVLTRGAQLPSSMTIAGHLIYLGGAQAIAYSGLQSGGGAPTATSSAPGLVMPDNTTTTVNGGVISVPLGSLLASPPAIGTASPAAGSFTTLGATGQLSVGGAFTVSGAGVTTAAQYQVASSGNKYYLDGGNSIYWDWNGSYTATNAWMQADGAVLGVTTNWTGSEGTAPTRSSLYVNQADSGTTTASPSLNWLSILDSLNAPFASGLNIVETFNAGATGGRNTLQVNAQQGGATSGLADWTAGTFYASGSASDGGTNTGTGAAGGPTALNPNASLESGATNFFSVVAMEADVAMQAGSSAGVKYGIQVVNASNDSVKATNENAGYKLASALTPSLGSPPVVGFDYGFQFGALPQNNPMDINDGTMIGTMGRVQNKQTNPPISNRPWATKYGFDASAMNFKVAGGDFLRGPDYAVDGAGQITFANGFLGTNSTGIQLDVPNQIVTSAAIATGGSPSIISGSSAGSYWPLEIVYGPSPNSQYEIATTKVVSAVVNAGGSGGTNGSCTITGTTGTGTPFQATGTVSGGALSGALTVTVAGSYTVNPTNIYAEPATTNCGLSGTTVTLGIGAATVNVEAPDVAAAGSSTYSNPVATTGGSGVGLTLNLTWAVRNTLALSPSGGPTTVGGPLTAATYATASNCASAASPGVCGSAAAGSVAVPTGTNPTLVVDTSAVTANSQILLTVDESLGTRLSVTCNTTIGTLAPAVVTARSPGTSFTIEIGATVATNPACVSYRIEN